MQNMEQVLSGLTPILIGDTQSALILDALPVAVYATDPQGRITYYNQAAADFWGCEPELLHTYWCGSFKLFWPDGTPLAHDECPMAIALKTGRPVRGLEAIVERPDGVRVPCIPHPTPIHDASGALIGAVNMLLDISERKNGERAGQHLAAIVESSDDAIVSKDLDGTIISWNKGAERLFGYSADEIIGKSVLTLIPKDRRHEEPGILARIRKGERIDHYETIRQRKDGTLMDVSLTVSPVRDGSGHIVGASKIARDVTEQKRAAAALDRRAGEQAALYQFTDKLFRAQSLDDIYDSALEAILRALRCTRASILLFDADSVMRFVRWHGLSEGYRQAVEGHSPWTADAANPAPVRISDIASADLDGSLKQTVAAEGIGALAFIPLMADGRLIGKFMVYYDTPHEFADTEIDLAVTIARQLGFSIERVRAEQKRDLLVAELNHRVKNTLATVVAISHQSLARGRSPEEAHHSFERRVRALAQTHGRLAETSWSGVSLEMLLADETAPYRDERGNVQIAGPRIQLSPKSAVSLGMAFHELTTNAAKYGALSTKEGNLEVTWSVTTDRELRIRWREFGGPAVQAPERRGFGRLLLERALRSDLDAEVDLDFAATGLECVITFPLDRSSPSRDGQPLTMQ
ncbi:MAG: PAS domain S-box protein [Alphaproteobacteria bacterium]